ncbi:hypothetical protein GW17_00031656 [Ensete ventricosum]|nr:hypothetical protein GW17_00031656 [Ensete ventricosum]
MAARWGEGLYSRTSGSQRQRGRGKEKRRGSDGEMKEEKVPPSERGNARRRSARLTRERRLPDRMRARKTRIRVKAEGRREKGEGPREGECVGRMGSRFLTSMSQAVVGVGLPDLIASMEAGLGFPTSMPQKKAELKLYDRHISNGGKSQTS